MSQTTFRATLRLERVEPHTDGNGYPRELCIEISAHTVTGDTPADAMVQLCAHADSLYEWHQQQTDEAAPVLDEAVKLGPPAFDLSKLFPRLFNPPPLHHCAVCGKPGPIKYEGNSWTCADCNAVLDAQKTEADLVDPRPASDGERRCLGGDPGRRCILIARHRGGCDPGNARRGFDATPNMAPRSPVQPTDKPPFVACKAPSPLEPNWFCRLPLGHRGEVCLFVPVDQLPDSADDEGEPGQEGAEAENDPGFAETTETTEAVYDDGAAKLHGTRIPLPGPVVITYDPSPSPGPASGALAQAVVDHVQRNVRRGIPPLTGI